MFMSNIYIAELDRNKCVGILVWEIYCALIRQIRCEHVITLAPIRKIFFKNFMQDRYTYLQFIINSSKYTRNI